jgi:hypothetical protein
MTEANIQKEIHIAVGSHPEVRVFRQNVGTGWQGSVVKRGPGHAALAPGDIVIRNPRPLRAGLCSGSSDLVGWRSVTITPEMVGTRVALFVAIEVKAPCGRATAEQKNFIARVVEAGGVAGIARSPRDAEVILCIEED